MGRSRLAILIPALNEAATISDVIIASLPYGDVIVVDDGSTDITGELARAVGAHVVRNQGPHGYDRALNVGFAEASRLEYEFVITMDADGEHDPNVLPSYCTALLEEEIPLVIGQREQPQRFAESLMAWFCRWRFGIRDPLCGMKGYWIGLYRENAGFDGTNSIGTDLALNSIRRGHAFCQIPVSGTVRKDTPRFGRTLKANYRISKVLVRLILVDFLRTIPKNNDNQRSLSKA